MIKNISDLESIINFIMNYRGDYVNSFEPFKIEAYNCEHDYIALTNLKMYTRISENKNRLDSRFNNLKDEEKNDIKLVNQLKEKVKKQKINKNINTILKIMTLGLFDWNGKIDKKLMILDEIEEIKYNNLVKINELKKQINERIKEQSLMKFAIKNDNLVKINKLENHIDKRLEKTSSMKSSKSI